MPIVLIMPNGLLGLLAYFSTVSLLCHIATENSSILKNAMISCFMQERALCIAIKLPVAQLDGRLTGDQEVAGLTTAEVSNILSWRLIMKYFLPSFSPLR